jgi:hypothetical protein
MSDCCLTTERYFLNDLGNESASGIFMTEEEPEALASNVAEIDIYRAAKQMIDLYDNEAGIRAALRADQLLEEGDTKGSAVWQQIVEAIKIMLNMTAPPERLN